MSCPTRGADKHVTMNHRRFVNSPFDVPASKIIEDIEHHFNEKYPQMKITVTGIITLFAHTIHNILTSMAKSYTFALCIITILMILLIGTVKIGFLSMIPNLVPILFIAGLMGWLDIPFDLSTMLIGSIAIGLVVDDTIHFLHNFTRYFNHHQSVKKAVRETMLSTGKAIMITSKEPNRSFLVRSVATSSNCSSQSHV